ncbi:NAD(P)-dependent alcohol dehydrogenase [Rhodococcus sp. NPDC127530]|uniref:NAD(P)-dependent alcohol dehydrogenase n=1 Tax=unclassified Rhodococcus (in: high G+C Gram-positive bacteria) TaxID=192944 RepID=UPI003627A6B9
MITVNARATYGAHEPFKATPIERRDVGKRDVLIDILHSGICHSDIHHAHDDYGRTHFPLVPGHEIAGTVAAVGSDVTEYAAGDRVGVGCMIGSCGKCAHCLNGQEQHCVEGDVKTANGLDRAGNPTRGGYADRIVVDANFVVRIPDALPLDKAAPLLCAGVTVYTPMRRYGVTTGSRVAIVGFGGLGHIAVQMSKAFGARTTVLDISLDKRDDGLRLGADEYVATSDQAQFATLASSFDLIICTVPVNLDYDAYLGLLDVGGTLVIIGPPTKPLSLNAFSLISKQRSIAGSLIGGIVQTQEMLDFCGSNGIAAEIETVSADEIDQAYERVLSGDVRYRFVIDASTFAPK